MPYGHIGAQPLAIGAQPLAYSVKYPWLVNNIPISSVRMQDIAIRMSGFVCGRKYHCHPRGRYMTEESRHVIT